eukprot:GFKZ01007907.1.p1 GENE.GFKZ01007907.1~~GFKZ01007907.1.p1  ORF type:complete len:235 (+),score=24.73 GFKZ01007907.1:275-979(+)
MTTMNISSPVPTFSAPFSIHVRHFSTLLSTSTSPTRPPVRHQVAQRPPAMTLVNDLVVKGLEVGLATYLGNAFVVQQTPPPCPPCKPKKSRLFNFGPTPPPPEPTPQPLDPAALNSLFSQLVSLANTLPQFIDSTHPESRRWTKLAICIAIDLVGSGSLAVPFVGDLLDLITAPLAAIMLQALFANTLVTMGGLAEELLPGTDAIPTATLAWLAENYGYLEDLGRGQEGQGRRE